MNTKTKDHGIGWAVKRFILVLFIGCVASWGLAYVFVPMYAWMSTCQRQAAAIILTAGLVGSLGLVWLYAWATNKI